MEKSYYEILGVDITSTDDVIKLAYKRRLLETHPDKKTHKNAYNPNTNEVNLIKDAYRVLSDSELRTEYNEQLDRKTKTQGLIVNGEGLDIHGLEEFEEIDGDFYKSCPRCTSNKAMKLTEEDLINGTTDGDGNYEVIVQCSDCSLWIKVQYAEEVDEI